MNMKNPEIYYKRTIGKNPCFLLRTFFMLNYNKKLKGNLALDLGCGAGNDTEFLLSKGFQVTAIDMEEQVRSIFENRNINSEYLNLIISDFSKIEVPRVDLLLANNSLFFVKDNFNLFLGKLLKNINSKGFFIGNFLGKDDDWNGVKTTVNKDELLSYFEDFEIVYFSEEKYYKSATNKKEKFWHVYNVIAQYKKKL